MRKLAFLLILSASPAFATFGAATAWDVRTTGVDTNGGAFDSGATLPGTDESQGSGTAITVTLTGTTTGTGSPAFSATTHGPGNFIHIASGTGCTVGWYEIVSQTSGTATFDHAMGTAANVCVGTIGGSLLTIGQANTNFVAGNTMWIQSGTYTQTASITWAVSTGFWTGYQTTHGDNGTKPLITTATNSVTLINTGSSNNGVQIFTNLSLSNTAGTRLSGIWQLGAGGTAQTWVFVSCIFDGFNRAIDATNGTPFYVAFIQVMNTEIKNSGLVSIALGNTGLRNLKVFGSYFHGNAQDIDSGLSSQPTIWLEYSIFANSTGAFDMNLSDPIATIDHCTFANNTNSSQTVGLSSASGFTSITNNIFYGSSNIALGGGSITIPSTIAAIAAGHSNAFGGNGTNFTQWAATPGDVTLTANPFTNAGAGDYSLNSTAGGGAAAKGAGFPGAFPGALSTGHADIGAVQSAGGGGAPAGNFGVSN